MIRKAEECKTVTRTAMREGPGSVKITDLATKEEMLNNARMHSFVELQPDCGIGYHEHTDETEIYYIIDGELLYNDNGTEVTIHAGDVTICPPGEGHSVTNITAVPAHLIATIILK